MSFDRKNGSVYFAVVAQILMSANKDLVFLNLNTIKTKEKAHRSGRGTAFAV